MVWINVRHQIYLNLSLLKRLFSKMQLQNQHQEGSRVNKGFYKLVLQLQQLTKFSVLFFFICM